jgi:REP element-mobilizing transposase RayT
LERTYFTVSANENIYGIFAMESFNNHVKLLLQKTEEKKIYYFKNEFLFVDYNSIYSLSNLKLLQTKL